MPPPPKRDRVDISTADEADFEYEVEPADEHVVAQEKARAQENVAQAEAAIDVDAIYRELDGSRGFDAAFGGFKPKFSIKTLLVAMTVIGVVLGLFAGGLLNGKFFAALICLSLLGLGSAHAWLTHYENRRREQLIAKRERELRKARGLATEADDDDEPLEAPPLDPIGELKSFLRERAKFSVKDLLILAGAVAVLAAFVELFESTGKAAAAFGALSVVGFALQVADIAMPRWLLLGWWFCLAGFCALTMLSIAIG